MRHVALQNGKLDAWFHFSKGHENMLLAGNATDTVLSLRKERKFILESHVLNM